jgi:hypothetical protein
MTPINHSIALTTAATTALFTLLPNQLLLVMKIKSNKEDHSGEAFIGPNAVTSENNPGKYIPYD